ncbi:hypothetical protein SAMN04488005_1267 [Yoonia tamlensis]|uniref:Uncharacterized protein n=1 Tax=Yoonia tamlensis TaxID=390270 RepID=A0A1I6G930_9RHOB|nr:hypothetical protein SAMN04488005_1267 [Yoonia tamlensis]
MVFLLAAGLTGADERCVVRAFEAFAVSGTAAALLCPEATVSS